MARQQVGAGSSRSTDLHSLGEFLAAVGRPQYKSGNIYYPSRAGAQATSTSWTVGTARAVPFYLDRTVTINGLASATVAATSGCNLQAYIYGSDQYGMITGSPLASATLAFTASNQGLVTALSGNVVLAPGVYWVIMSCDTASVTFQAFALDLFAMETIGSTGVTNLRGGQLTWTLSLTYGSSPGASPTLSEANAVSCPLVGFRVV